MQNFLLLDLKIESFLKNNFNSKKATLICFLIAWINKSLIAFFFTNLVADKSLYLLFSESMLHGHAPLEPVKFLGSRFTQYIFNEAVTSPFYSLIALPFLWATNSFFATSIILDVLAWGILLSGLFMCAKIILKEQWIVNILILCVGFFLFIYEFGSSPKDTFSIGFLLWGTFISYKLVTEKPHWQRTSFALLIYISIGLTKLLYAPLVLIFFLFLFYHSFKRKEKLFFKHTILLFVLILAAFFIFSQYLIFLKTNYANNLVLYYNDMGQRGFFPENLLKTYPFISSAFINTNFWCVQLSDIFHFSYSFFLHLFQALDILLFLLLILGLYKILKEQLSDNKLWGLFILLSGSIGFMLSYMSIRYGTAYFSYVSKGWTYVQEARFFLYIMFVLQILLFYLIFKSGFLDRSVKNFLLLLFLIECTHGLYFSMKQFSHTTMETIANRRENEILRTYVQIQKRSSRHIALVTTNNTLRRYAQVFNIDVYAFPNMYSTSIKKDSTFYLSVVYPPDSPIVNHFFKHRNIIFLDSIQSFVVNFIN